jgi:hypothetical protein
MTERNKNNIAMNNLFGDRIKVSTTKKINAELDYI